MLVKLRPPQGPPQGQRPAIVAVSAQSEGGAHAREGGSVGSLRPSPAGGSRRRARRAPRPAGGRPGTGRCRAPRRPTCLVPATGSACPPPAGTSSMATPCRRDVGDPRGGAPQRAQPHADLGEARAHGHLGRPEGVRGGGGGPRGNHRGVGHLGSVDVAHHQLADAAARQAQRQGRLAPPPHRHPRRDDALRRRRCAATRCTARRRPRGRAGTIRARTSPGRVVLATIAGSTRSAASPGGSAIPAPWRVTGTPGSGRAAWISRLRTPRRARARAGRCAGAARGRPPRRPRRWCR